MTAMMPALMKTEPRPDELSLSEVPVPHPRSDEVLIEVRAAGICGTDLHIKHWRGWAERRGLPLPLIIGHEFSGVVVEAGSGVRAFRLGDRVAGDSHVPCRTCYYCLTGKAHLCRTGGLLGLNVPGCLARYIAMPDHAVVKLRDEISFEEAAMIEPAGGPFRAVAAVEPAGANVLLVGCGPVGLFGMGWARVLGAGRIIALEVSAYRQELARQAGADVVLNPVHDDVRAHVMEATGGLGVDAMIDFSGNPRAIRDALPLVRSAGRVVFFGLPGEPVAFDLAEEVIFRELTLRGIIGRELFGTWFTIQNLLASKRFQPLRVVTHRFPLTEFDQAFALLEQRNAGKILLYPNPTEGQRDA